MTEVITGPFWAARNWNINDGEGSIHDDETAAELGFRRYSLKYSATNGLKEAIFH